LDFTEPGKLSYPNSVTYQFEESRYWSQQQAAIQPACRFTPASALDVSLAVLTSRVTGCKFAVKSGGHAAFVGASNIDGGVTLDLRNLNQVVVSADKKQTAVGAGNIWYDVYLKLQPMGLTVIGGRVSAIGVGGLTLGGGISFFSNRYGWACDNVNNYQVSLPAMSCLGSETRSVS
jgi:FAD/FMN-containing dehydrogenase